jgi:hypothetical protein
MTLHRTLVQKPFSLFYREQMQSECETAGDRFHCLRRSRSVISNLT